MLLDHPYPLLARLSLALATIGGFGLGLLLLLSFAFNIPLAWNVGALIQAHGHVQTLGFVTLFILAVGTRLLPGFHRTRLEHPRRVSVGGIVLALAVAVRAIVQPLDPSPARAVLLLAAGTAALVGVLLALSALADAVRKGKPAEQREPVILPLTMALSILGALVLNLIGSITLAQGAALVPGPLDEATIHFELWGFASTMVLAIGRHTWPTLLLF